MKCRSLLSGILMTGLFVFSGSSNAQTYNYRGLLYQIIAGEYVFINYIGTDEVVEIPDVNFRNLPNNAFTNKSNIKYVSFPSTLQTIGENAFSGSTNIKSIYFRGAPPIIQSNSFSGLTDTLIIYNTNQSGWSSSFGGLVTKANSTEFSAQLEGDGFEYAISGYTGTGGNLSIPFVLNGLPVKRIKYSVFQNNTNITSVKIPPTVLSIDHRVFENCTNLESVELSEGLTYMGDWNFINSPKIKSIVLPNSLNSTGIRVFEGCTGLTNIVLGSGLTNIAASMFSGCSSLKELTIPSTVKRIEDGAFGDGEFGNNNALEQITFEEGLLSIGQAFSSPVSLKSIVLPNSLTNLGLAAFNGASAVTNIIIGNSLTSIPWLAFGGCVAAKEIVMGNSVTSIGDNAFMNCNSLTNLVFGKNLKSIGAAAFYMCTNLVNLNLPSSIESIGDGAFQGAGKITSVVFPASLTSLGNMNFSSARLYFKGSPPLVSTNFYHSTNIYYLPQSSGWTTNNLNGSQTTVWDLPKQNLTISRNHNQLTLQLNTSEGFSHTIQESENLSHWADIKTFDGNGNSVTETTNVNSVSKKFFRVLRQ